MSKIVTIPTVWGIYEVPDEILAILGNQVQTPPHIVIEMLVASGAARKVMEITASEYRKVGGGKSKKGSKSVWFDGHKKEEASE